MSEILNQWVKNLCVAAIITGIAMTLTPKGRVRDVLRLVCGLAMVMALISPLTRLDMDGYAISLARYREEYQQYYDQTQEKSDRLVRSVIEQECATYILDKAQLVGLRVTSAEVTAKWGDEEKVWYPYEVYIEFEGDISQTSGLADTIEADLGVPRERQYWSLYGQ